MYNHGCDDWTLHWNSDPPRNSWAELCPEPRILGAEHSSSAQLSDPGAIASDFPSGSLQYSEPSKLGLSKYGFIKLHLRRACEPNNNDWSSESAVCHGRVALLAAQPQTSVVNDQ